MPGQEDCINHAWVNCSSTYYRLEEPRLRSPVAGVLLGSCLQLISVLRLRCHNSRSELSVFRSRDESGSGAAVVLSWP